MLSPGSSVLMALTRLLSISAPVCVFDVPLGVCSSLITIYLKPMVLVGGHSVQVFCSGCVHTVADEVSEIGTAWDGRSG